MKKIIITSILASTVASTTFAAAPITNFEAGQSAVELNYGLSQHNKIDDTDAEDFNFSSRPSLGLALQTAVNDKWAIQYSYNPIFSSKPLTVVELPDDPANVAPALRAASPTKPAVATAKVNVKLHQLQGYYKENQNLNLYAGLDYIKSKTDFSGQIYEADNTGINQIVDTSQHSSSSKLGVSGGVVAHTKLDKNTTAFAQLGIGTILKYQAKFGISHELTKDLSVSATYDLNKYKIKNNDENINFKHHGLTLGVNYKF